MILFVLLVLFCTALFYPDIILSVYKVFLGLGVTTTLCIIVVFQWRSVKSHIGPCAHVLVHCVKSIRAYNVKSFSTHISVVVAQIKKLKKADWHFFGHFSLVHTFPNINQLVCTHASDHRACTGYCSASWHLNSIFSTDLVYPNLIQTKSLEN